MTLNNMLLAAAVAAAALTACGPSRDNPDGGVNPPSGCVGVCSQDGGNNQNGDAGTTTDGGNNQNDDAGTTTDGGDNQNDDAGTDGGGVLAAQIRTVRTSKAFDGTLHRLEGVAISAIDVPLSSSGRIKFWVVDPQEPSAGLLVDLRGTDTLTPEGAVLEVGDVVNVQGYLGLAPNYYDREGRRPTLQNLFQNNAVVDPLVVEKVGSGQALTPYEVPAGFGNADGGFAKPNPEFAGGLVKIPGRLVLTNPNPTAFMRVGAGAGDTYYGFEVSEGVLVNNYRTYDRTSSDGGVAEVRCDWRQIALDAGVNGQQVVFPDGIVGVWDTYTHAPCSADGGTGSDCFREAGRVPGTYDAGAPTTTGNYYTYVVYPQNCESLQGEVVDAE